jgi:hypothetical protein
VRRETTVILAALGVIPVYANAENGTAQVEQAFAMNPRTISIVQALIERNALYANAEGTELRIRASVLENGVLDGIMASGKVKADEESGDFIVNQTFASALAKSRVLHENMPKTVADYLLLQKLEGEQESDLQIEQASFHSAPFF